jgi:hypothetical protein
MINTAEVKSAILERLREADSRGLKTAAIGDIREEFLTWMAQLRFPATGEGDSWEARVRTFPPADTDERESSRLHMRLALRLCTPSNRYLISVMECLAPDGRGVHVLTVHANWRDDERLMQKRLDEGYVGRFDDMLKTKHTIWAQTVRTGELHEALNSCAVAILGNELVAEPAAPNTVLVKNPYPKTADFPNRPKDEM